jgi:hypothetical protein
MSPPPPFTRLRPPPTFRGLVCARNWILYIRSADPVFASLTVYGKMSENVWWGFMFWSMKMTVVWDVVPCGLVAVYQSFRCLLPPLEPVPRARLTHHPDGRLHSATCSFDLCIVIDWLSDSIPKLQSLVVYSNNISLTSPFDHY